MSEQPVPDLESIIGIVSPRTDFGSEPDEEAPDSSAADEGDDSVLSGEALHDRGVWTGTPQPCED